MLGTVEHRPVMRLYIELLAMTCDGSISRLAMLQWKAAHLNSGCVLEMERGPGRVKTNYYLVLTRRIVGFRPIGTIGLVWPNLEFAGCSSLQRVARLVFCNAAFNKNNSISNRHTVLQLIIYYFATKTCASSRKWLFSWIDIAGDCVRRRPRGGVVMVVDWHRLFGTLRLGWWGRALHRFTKKNRHNFIFAM